jgi:hypothetical protein
MFKINSYLPAFHKKIKQLVKNNIPCLIAYLKIKNNTITFS